MFGNKPILKKMTQELQWKTKRCVVGKTDIQLKFTDGREFIHTVYGRMDQHIFYGYNSYIDSYSKAVMPVDEPTATEPLLYKSQTMAEDTINRYPMSGKFTLTPSHAVIGELIEAKILDTDESYEKECNIAIVAPKLNTST